MDIHFRLLNRTKTRVTRFFLFACCAYGMPEVFWMSWGWARGMASGHVHDEVYLQWHLKVDWQWGIYENFSRGDLYRRWGVITRLLSGKLSKSNMQSVRNFTPKMHFYHFSLPRSHADISACRPRNGIVDKWASCFHIDLKKTPRQVRVGIISNGASYMKIVGKTCGSWHTWAQQELGGVDRFASHRSPRYSPSCSIGLANKMIQSTVSTGGVSFHQYGLLAPSLWPMPSRMVDWFT